MKTFDQYQHLAGSWRSGSSLWMGPDHLLYVDATGFLLPFSETYRRIDYAKIQAISYGRTGRYIWLGILLALPLLLFGFITVIVAFENPHSWGVFIPGVPTLLSLLLFIVHLAKGPTCVCNLQTAVQMLPLKPLRRMRTTLSCVNELVELCRLHQSNPSQASPSPAPAPLINPLGSQ